MDNMEDAVDDRITGLTRRFDEQSALITALSSRVGFLEDELRDMDRRLARAGRRPPTPVPGPPPVVIDLTDLSDDEEDEGIMVEDDEESLIGGPIEDVVQIRQETPPSQELLEALRLTPIRDEDNTEYNREADLLVRAGLALPGMKILWSIIRYRVFLMISLCCLICREWWENGVLIMNVLKLVVVGKGTLSCEEIVIGKNGKNKA